MLARVPIGRIRVGALVDRKIALEHAAAGAEAFDAGLEIRPERPRQGFRGERTRLFVEIEAADPHAEPAEFNVCVRAARERPDRGGPAGENFVAAPRVAANAERPADVVEHDASVGEFLRERGELVDLRMIEPGVEGEPERGEFRKSFAEALVAEQAGRRPVARVHDGGIRVPSGDVPDAAMPLTNSVSPRGRSSSGPSRRYMARHCTNTVATTLWPLSRSARSSSSR